MAYDGSIRINTKFDTSGIDEGVKKVNKSLKSQAATLAAQYKKQGMNASDAFKRAWSEIERESKTSSQKVAKSLKIFTKIDPANFKAGFKSMGQSIKSFNAKMTRLTISLGKFVARMGVIALAGVAAFSVFAKSGIEAASDLQEVQNVVDTAFGEMSYKCEEFASTAKEAFGLSEYSAKKMASTYMAMGKSMGLSMEQASDMAINASKRTADIASFYNLTAEEAAVKFKSIYTGETETLKDLGIVMTEANLKQYALSQGITKSYSAMTQAEKVALRYAFVMNASKDAAGDFARTQDSWANQTKILSENFREFKTVIGSYLITALTPVVKTLNTIISQITMIAKSAKELLSSIFGIEFQEAAASASGTASGIADIESGYEDAAAATKKASKAQKDYNKSLASFDRLNILSSGKDSSKKTDESSVTDQSMVNKLLGSSQADDSAVKKTKDSIDSISEKLKGLLKTLQEDMQKGDFSNIGEALGNKVNSGLKKINWTNIKNTLSNIARSIGTFLNGAIKTINWRDIGRCLMELINSAITFLSTLIGTIDWSAVGSAIGNTLYGALETIDGKLIAEAISNVIKGALDLMSGFLDAIDWSMLPLLIVTKIIDFFKNLDYSGIASALGTFIGKALKAVVNFAAGVRCLCKAIVTAIINYFKQKKKENGNTIFGAIFGGLLDLMKNIRDWVWNNIVKPFLSSLITAIAGKDAAEKFENWANGIFDGLKEQWAKLKLGILAISAMLKDPLGTVKKVWQAIKDAWSKIVTAFSIHVEFKQDGLNKVQKAAVKLFKLDGWPQFSIGAKALGGIFKNGAWKNIPQFASGMPSGIRGSLFFAGEAGPEIVAQGRSGSSEILNASQIASAIYSAVVAANKTGGGRAVVQIVPDTGNLYKAIVKQNDRNILITNKNPFNK